MRRFAGLDVGSMRGSFGPKASGLAPSQGRLTSSGP